MDETQLVIAALIAVTFFLTIGLVFTNLRLAQHADKCINHALAESENQREMIRIKFESDHQELLLRESRARDKSQRMGRVQPPAPEPSPDILVATGRPDLN